MPKQLHLFTDDRRLQTWLRVGIVVPGAEPKIYDRCPKTKKPLVAVVDTGSTISSIPRDVLSTLLKDRVPLTAGTRVKDHKLADGSFIPVDTFVLDFRLTGSGRGAHVTSDRDWGDARGRGVAVLHRSVDFVLLGMDLLRNWELRLCRPPQRSCIEIPD